jgi:Ig-like domain-containing protein/immunoglobulin I-set domain protein
MVIGSGSHSKRFRKIGFPRGFTKALTPCFVLIAAGVAFLAGCTGVVNTTTTNGGTSSNGSGNGSGAATAPVITTQPVSQSVSVGQSVNFVVVATGSAPLTYQWQKTGVNISGATSNSYTTPAAATGDNGARFTVVVSNSAGSATSNAAILTVTSTQQGNTAPQIITQPASQTVTAGQSATFTVVATGSPTLTYQWQKNGANIAGATSASYSTPATATSDSGESFDVIVTNSFGTVTSNSASLTVNPSTGSNPPPPSGSSTDVTTYHYDNLRTGQNTHETTLTHANVNSSTFGLLGSFPVDGHVDAQPLYLSAVAIPGQGTKNVLYVVTEHDSVYAFDADSVTSTSATTLWHSSVLGAGETSSDDRGCGQVTPEIGITSTPVIDRTRNAIYLVAVSKTSGGSYVHRFHALNLTTGAELFGGPTTITATYPGSGANSSNGNVVFDPSQYNERPGLLEVGGTIFTTWGSHCDGGPYTSWVMVYSADTLHQTGVINMVPNGNEGGIWMAGAAPGADASGNIYFIIGNGDFGTTLDSNGFPANKNCGNCFAKISSTLPLTLSDYFTPLNTVAESNADTDFGSGGPLLLPDVTDSNGQTRHLAVGAGKDQIIYVVDRDNMGKFNSSNDNIYQQISGALSGGVWSKPSYFNGVVYYGAVGDSIKAFPISAGKLATTASSKSSHTFGYPGATPAISANGTSDGIVWVVENSNNGVLHAYDATNLATELYNSTQGSNGQFSANKFITPMITNGRVYIGTQTSVVVFGLK